MGKVIGIDLGTTNSAVAVIEGDSYEVIDNADGGSTTPSIVAFTDDGEILVGEAAKNQAVTNPENTFYAVKRLIGRRFDDPEVQKMIKTAPFKIIKADNGDAWVQAGDKKYAPAQISAEVLKYMKKTAEDYLGEDVTDAVVTVPAYFNDSQRQATRDAGKIAGLDVKRIVNEPTAAALAYGIAGKTKGGKVAVFDLGGGTYDISILEMSDDGVYEVKAANGDTFLGGEDFDHRIMEYLIEEFKTQTGVDLHGNEKDPNIMQALQRIKGEAEKAKIALSSRAEYNVNLPFLAEGKNLSLKINRSKLELLVDDLIERTKQPMELALKDAGLSISDIDEVILVGGMTRMPKVREVVKEFFGKEPNQKINPVEVVGAGAAVQGGIISGDVQDVLLLDVIPLTIGIETLGGVMSPMVKRNTTIPTTYAEEFSTAEDNQDAVTVRVYQGEREMVAGNKLLGEFHLVGIPPAPRGVPRISVEFNVDANGNLSVTAQDKGTGLAQKIQVQANGGLSDAEVEQMMKDAAENSEADKARKEEVVTRNDAEGLVIAMQKNIEQFGDKVSGEEKQTLEQAVQQLEDALQSNADTAALRASMETVSTAATEFGKKLYEQASAAEQAAQQAADQADEQAAEDVVEEQTEEQTEEKKPDAPQAKKPGGPSL